MTIILIGPREMGRAEVYGPVKTFAKDISMTERDVSPGHRPSILKRQREDIDAGAALPAVKRMKTIRDFFPSEQCQTTRPITLPKIAAKNPKRRTSRAGRPLDAMISTSRVLILDAPVYADGADGRVIRGDFLTRDQFADRHGYWPKDEHLFDRCVLIGNAEGRYASRGTLAAESRKVAQTADIATGRCTVEEKLQKQVSVFSRQMRDLGLTAEFAPEPGLPNILLRRDHRFAVPDAAEDRDLYHLGDLATFEARCPNDSIWLRGPGGDYLSPERFRRLVRYDTPEDAFARYTKPAVLVRSLEAEGVGRAGDVYLSRAAFGRAGGGDISRHDILILSARGSYLPPATLKWAASSDSRFRNIMSAGCLPVELAERRNEAAPLTLVRTSASTFVDGKRFHRRVEASPLESVLGANRILVQRQGNKIAYSGSFAPLPTEDEARSLSGDQRRQLGLACPLEVQERSAATFDERSKSSHGL